METKKFTVRNMKETLVNWCGGDPEEFERIRYLFDEMNRMGFVGDYDLLMFERETCDWKIDGDFLVDSAEDDKIVFDFGNGRSGGEYHEYRA